MNSRILLAVAIIMTVITAILIRNQLAQQPAATANVASVSAQPAAPRRILVARRDLIPGMFIHSAQDLEWSTAPKNAAPEAAPKENKETLSGILTKEKNENSSHAAVPANASLPIYIYEGTVALTDFNGSIVRHSLRTGEPVTSAMLMRSDDGGFLSAVLAPGMCAITISVNATSGNAGFVSPGDRIDLLATHRARSAATTSGEGQVVSEIFVHNVRVVAVDQMLDNPDNKAILAKTVTVEVTPDQAQQIAIAGERGKISVVLLSNSNIAAPTNAVAGATEEKGATTATASRPVQSPVQPKEQDDAYGLAPRMRVIHGDQIQEVEFYKE